LRGEKVDVVQWRDDIGQFIAEALGPAKVKEVNIDEATKTADVVVSEHQLSLAIGKEGQNARLAARLSGYKVDIRSDSEGVVEEEAAVAETAADEIPAPSEAETTTPTQTEPAPAEVEVELSEPASDDEDEVVAPKDEESE
jgi:N utilization substance protein A